MLRKFLPLFFLAFAALVITSPLQLHTWELSGDQLLTARLPAGVKSIPTRITANLEGDPAPETLALADGHLSIISASKVAWQSPEEWQVLQAEFSDLNHDGSYEATLLVWRPFRSWPVDQWQPYGGRIAGFQDAGGYSCQIILIGRRNGQYQEMWAGSALAEPVKTFAVADLNEDGSQEMVTLENTYADPRSAPGRAVKIWEWNGFGFTIVTKMDGIFSKMALVQASDGRILILVP